MAPFANIRSPQTTIRKRIDSSEQTLSQGSYTLSASSNLYFQCYRFDNLHVYARHMLPKKLEQMAYEAICKTATNVTNYICILEQQTHKHPRNSRKGRGKIDRFFNQVLLNRLLPENAYTL